MASTGRRASPSVIGHLVANPYRFDFFQAVRLLERLSQDCPDRPGGTRYERVGADGSPAREAVRFRALPSHSFPPSPLCSLTLSEKKDAVEPLAEMIVSFLGLTGPNGVLPHHYTSLVIDRVRNHDPSLRDFFDIFNHRLISLFYRAWGKYRLPIGYERAKLFPRSEPSVFVEALHSLVGLAEPSLRRRLETDDEAFLFYGGYFAHFRPNAVSLESLLSDYFGLPARVEQFLGQWLYLSEEDQSSMPSPEWPDGRNCVLGQTVIVGQRVWSVENAFRIRLGPLDYREFEQFLPSGTALTRLGQLVRTYVGPEYDCDFQLILKADEVPECQLDSSETANARLGWNTWLISRRPDRDADEAVFKHDGMPTRRHVAV